MKISRINLNSSSSFSSSSISATEEHEDFSAFDNLVSMKHELSNICPTKIRIVNELDDLAEEKEGTSIYNPIIVSDDSWNPQNVDYSTLDDKKFVSWRNTKHETSSDLILSPSQGNVYVPSSSDVSSEDDTINNASDIAFAKDIFITKSSGVADAPDTVVKEEDVQERSNKAAFAQELFMSTLFSE